MLARRLVDDAENGLRDAKGAGAANSPLCAGADVAARHHRVRPVRVEAHGALVLLARPCRVPSSCRRSCAATVAGDEA